MGTCCLSPVTRTCGPMRCRQNTGSSSRRSADKRWFDLPMAGTISVVAGLLIWEFVSRVIVANALFLAAPTQIGAAIAALARTGELWIHLGISSAEFALGYAIASVLGIAAGLAMANSAIVKRAMTPWVSGLYATPTIALAPLFILWFGIGIWSK